MAGGLGEPRDGVREIFREGEMDTVTKAQRSLIMSKIRGKNTAPERRFGMLLVRNRIRFKKWSALPGRPDFVLFDKIAVFVDGCYWHNCPRHGSKPKSNVSFWEKKFKRNMERDKEVTSTLRGVGYAVWRFWEHEVAKKGFARRVLRHVKWVSPSSAIRGRFRRETGRPGRQNA